MTYRCLTLSLSFTILFTIIKSTYNGDLINKSF